MIFADLIRADLSDHLNPWSIHLCLDRGVVPKGGLEPPRVAPYAPQTYVSTSSTTSASSRETLYRPKDQTDDRILLVTSNAMVSCRAQASPRSLTQQAWPACSSWSPPASP